MTTPASGGTNGNLMMRKSSTREGCVYVSGVLRCRSQVGNRSGSRSNRKWPENRGVRGTGSGYLFLLFSTVSRPDLAGKCVKIQVQLSYFLQVFSDFLQPHVQTDDRKSFLLVHRCFWAPSWPSEGNCPQSVLVAMQAVVAPVESLGTVKHIECIVGSLPHEDGVSRLFTLTVPALNYSQDCISICQEYSSSSFGGLISAYLRNGHVWDVWADRRRQFQPVLDYLPLKQFYFNNRAALWENKQLYMKNVSSFILYSGLTFPAFLFRQVCF